MKSVVTLIFAFLAVCSARSAKHNDVCLGVFSEHVVVPVDIGKYNIEFPGNLQDVNLDRVFHVFQHSSKRQQVSWVYEQSNEKNDGKALFHLESLPGYGIDTFFTVVYHSTTCQPEEGNSVWTEEIVIPEIDSYRLETKAPQNQKINSIRVVSDEQANLFDIKVVKGGVGHNDVTILIKSSGIETKAKFTFSSN